nr:glycosyltransferase family 4 protein [uncultured Draconibacterium sp.]
MTKKVLIITYYWPPAGGPGVQRVLKFAKYLPEFGWEPIILTVENGDYHAIDKSLLKDIPKDLKIHKIATFSVLDLYKKIFGSKKAISSFELTKNEGGLRFKLIKWVRANFFIPDARGGWKRAAVKKGIEIIKEEKPDIIFTSSPPHSLQLIGLKLKRKTGLKWVADFRDPWTDAFWDKELPRLKILERYNRWLEYKTLSNADLCTIVSEGFSELLKKDRQVTFKILPNGFDAEDFDKFKYQRGQKFRITYIGSIAKSQNPIHLFKSISLLPQKIQALLDINFFGVFDASVKNAASELKAPIHFHAYIPHNTAIKKMVNSEMLILLIPRNTKGILTGKLYEYLASNNFILTIAPDGSEVEKIIDRCNSGATVSFQDDPSRILLDQITRWQRKQLLNCNTGEIEKLSRKSITQKLSEIFNKIIEE